MGEKIAVIMTAYNEEKEWVCECMDSLLGQTYRDLHLYVLLDNPENDALKNLLKSYEEKDSRVSFFVNEKNLGLVMSLNKLLNMVTEPYIARMDADDICEIDRLEKEMKFLTDNNLDFVMTGCSFLYPSGERGCGQSLPVLVGEAFNEASAYGNVSLHNTWLMKKEVYDSLNGYRDIRFCEDYDFVLRAIQHKFAIGRMSEETAVYRLRAGSVSSLNAKEQFEKARLLRYMYRKGRRVSKISPEKLNDKFSDYGTEQKEKFAAAKTEVDAFAGSLYDGNYIKAMGKAVKIMLLNSEGRRLFFIQFFGRCRLSAVYKKAKRNLSEDIK
ncbi:MAG: glycosyltransferase [Clostridium sp.]|nr:glycosyltransferase [Clostridium sp.]MCM1173244.1 glycosyltransferase [Clostridium sp.]MCM1208354.1 glycosyltransferase [Ruminococcus sp.]